MVQLKILLCGIALLGSVATRASTFRVTVDSGEMVIIQKSSQVSRTVTDSASVTLGDSLILLDGYQAQLQLENSSRLLCKGPINIRLSGDNILVQIALDGEGQVFLERNKP